MSDVKRDFISSTSVSRQEIINFNTPESNSETDDKIKKEAEVRFWYTFEEFHGTEFIAHAIGVEGPEVNDNLYSAHMELADTEVSSFLQKATALRIKTNRKLDQFEAESNFDEEKSKVKKSELEVKYRSDVRHLYRSMLDYPNEARLNEILKMYPDIEDPEREYVIPLSIVNEYQELSDDAITHEVIVENGLLKYIDVDRYIQLATKIGDECVKNSYLEELFLTFIPKEIEQEKQNLPATETEDSERKALLERLRQVEEKTRIRIKEIYGVDLPDMEYLDKQPEMGMPEAINYLLDSNTTRNARFSGGFEFTLDTNGRPDTIRKLIVYYDPSLPFILNAGTVFEELYHASGFPFQKQQHEKYWPGWEGDGNGSLFEEALAKLEKDIFLKKNYPVEYHAPGNPRELVVRYMKGEEVDGKIYDVLPEVFIKTLMFSVGRNLISEFRKARSEGDGALTHLQQIVNDKFGSGIFDFLSTVDVHNQKEMFKAMRMVYKIYL